MHKIARVRPRYTSTRGARIDLRSVDHEKKHCVPVVHALCRNRLGHDIDDAKERVEQRSQLLHLLAYVPLASPALGECFLKLGPPPRCPLCAPLSQAVCASVGDYGMRAVGFSLGEVFPVLREFSITSKGFFFTITTL